MGPLGVASRILGGRYGAPFTFASSASGRGTAAGQLTARVLAERYRVRSIGREHARLRPARQRRRAQPVAGDPEPRVRGARDRRGVRPARRPSRSRPFVDALPALGLSGWSVTRPYKVGILDHLDSVTPHAAEAGSANTVVVQDGRLVGLEHGRRRRARRRCAGGSTLPGAGSRSSAPAARRARLRSRSCAPARASTSWRAGPSRRARSRPPPAVRARASTRSPSCRTTCS